MTEAATTGSAAAPGTKLRVEDLHLSYGDNAILKGVSMQLAQGEVVSLLGPSGSGKTTLLRAVAGLEAPHRGTIRIEDRPVLDAGSKLEVPAEKRNLGLVFQSYALWPHRTVFDNVAYGLKLRKVSSAETRQRVESALGNLGLGHLGERLPHQLSGGQQQRVAIARALVYNPPVILMDEPLSNLDAKLREEARAWLRELILKMRLSALVVTHDQNEAMAMSDRILLLNNGVIEQQGTPQQLYGHPDTLFVADFMGSNNRIEGKVAEQHGGETKLAGDGWELWGQTRGIAAAGAQATGMVRLERVRLAPGAGENALQLALVTSMFIGDRWEYLFQRNDLRLRAYGSMALAAGDQWLEIPRESLWIF
ncbi:MAG: ABC transporter ATP-binding protein [Pseudomonadota bacterium]|nr:ABC transporter ATP-binding protein [Pseudomonadota bacterium]